MFLVLVSKAAQFIVFGTDRAGSWEGRLVKVLHFEVASDESGMGPYALLFSGNWGTVSAHYELPWDRPESPDE
jgi:hypothetical protein